MLDTAIVYRDRYGWSVLPMIGKRPPEGWKWGRFQHRLPTDEELRDGFALPGITGLAVICGPVSGGLVIRDFDNADAYRCWAALHPEFASALPTAQTRRGYHVYARLADPVRTVKLVDGEVRGQGAYCVAPPSAHPDGGCYAWTIPPGDSIRTVAPVILEARVFTPKAKGQETLLTQETERQETQEPKNCLCPTLQWNEEIESAVASTLPSGPGQRHRCLFELARRLRALGARLSDERLHGIARVWHCRALSNIRTKEFTESSRDFRIAYERVRVPHGSVLNGVAATIPRGLPKLQRLAALCAALQTRWGDRPFPLGVRVVAELLGAPRMTAWRLIQGLLADGRLQLVNRGDHATGQASEYRWQG